MLQKFHSSVEVKDSSLRLYVCHHVGKEWMKCDDVVDSTYHDCRLCIHWAASSSDVVGFHILCVCVDGGRESLRASIFLVDYSSALALSS